MPKPKPSRVRVETSPARRVLSLDSIRIDKHAEVEGRWFDDFPYGGRFLIARAGNPNFMAVQAQLLIENANHIDIEGNLPPEVAQEITQRSAARALLLDWENVAVGGEPSEYTSELGEELFTDPEFSTLYTYVVNKASNIENYRKVQETRAEGNS